MKAKRGRPRKEEKFKPDEVREWVCPVCGQLNFSINPREVGVCADCGMDPEPDIDPVDALAEKANCCLDQVVRTPDGGAMVVEDTLGKKAGPWVTD